MTLQEELAARVRLDLTRKGWSQKDLAERAHYSQKHVSQMLTGQGNASLDAWQRLLTVLDDTEPPAEYLRRQVDLLVQDVASPRRPGNYGDGRILMRLVGMLEGPCPECGSDVRIVSGHTEAGDYDEFRCEACSWAKTY